MNLPPAACDPLVIGGGRREVVPAPKGGRFVKKLAVAAMAIGVCAAAASPAAAQGAAAISTLNMQAVPDLARDNVRTVQRALEQKGFDPGPPDGIVGPRTREAVRRFQDRYGMTASGDIDNQLLFALGQSAIAGR
jgi:peptidoglycan hydrolase-like protein with peptidoglycan-binding domain